MVFLLIEGAEPFRVYQQYRQLLVRIVGRVEELPHQPEALGARVDRRSHPESTLGTRMVILSLDVLEEELVQKVGLAGAVLSAYCYHADFLLHLVEEIYGVFV